MSHISDVSVEEPVEDEVVGLGRLELRGHVASAVDGSESETAFVRLPVSSNLAFNSVLFPLINGVPSKGSDPVLGSNCGHGTIGVTGVVKHLNLACELLIDPLRGLRLGSVVDVTLAKVPSLNVIRDVHGLADLIRVHVVEETSAPGARWEIVERLRVSCLGEILQPRSVVLSSDPLAVVSWGILGVKMREALGCLRLRIGTSTPAGSEDVINVDLADVVVEAHVEASALIGDIGHVGHVPIAVSIGELLVLLLTHERVPVGHIDEGGSGVILPVGNTVSDSETLEVRLEGVCVISVLLVVLDDVVGKVGDIDSSIRLTRDVKLVLLELREEFVPLEDGGEVVLSASVIIEGAVLGALTVGVTDTSGLLDVKDVGLSVPRVSILGEVGATRGKLEGTVLLHEAEHG